MSHPNPLPEYGVRKWYGVMIQKINTEFSLRRLLEMMQDRISQHVGELSQHMANSLRSCVNVTDVCVILLITLLNLNQLSSGSDVQNPPDQKETPGSVLPDVSMQVSSSRES